MRRKRLLRIRNFLYLTAVTTLLAAGCRKKPEPAPPVQTRVHPEDVAPEKPVVHFAVISRYNPRIMYEEYQPIMDYLTAHTPFRFELMLGKSYRDAVEFLCGGIAQVASLGGLTYLEAHQQCGAVPVVRPLNENGEPIYHSLIVVRKDSPLRSLLDLRGHTLAFASRHSTSGHLVPRAALLRAGVKLESLKEYRNLPHHDSVARAVLSGRFDAGAVKDIIAQRYLDRGLRVLFESPPIPSVPIVVRPDCDSTIVTAVKRAFLRIDPTDPKQREMMKTWNAEFRHGFTEAHDRDYDSLRALLQFLHWQPPEEAP